MNGPIGLHTHADVTGVEKIQILKVLTFEEAHQAQFALPDTLIWNGAIPGSAGSLGQPCPGIQISNLKDPRVVQPGDVIRLRPGSSLISVLYRRGSKANTLFATEQCNSNCIMCSQPPRNEDDSWRIGELAQTIRLIDKDEIQVGVSGGEPTLLGDRLGDLIAIAEQHLPNTTLHILSNGRLFAVDRLAERIANKRLKHVVWAVPLYGDVASVHDAVIDAPGGFEQTLKGLYELGRLGARVEIRVVLHKMTIGRLPQLASFIYRRLPFVEHIALMGLEPMGFAKRNRERLWIDPRDYLQPLEQAVFHLANRGLTPSIYNLPLCVLPQHLWRFAEQSISDWKNIYPEECRGCAATSRCAGFFASAGPTWRSQAIHPLNEEDLVA